MKLRIVTVSSRPPKWIQQGYDEYAHRMPREFSLDLVEVKPEARGSGTLSEAGSKKFKRAESARIRATLIGFEQVIALDERGKSLSTTMLAQKLQHWQSQAMNAAFVIGGADGLDSDFTASASMCLSLSAMTLPHQLVRVVLAEQLYRAVSILNNHPYHRV